MPEYARVCQSMPEYARVCQSMPEYAIVCQSMQEYAKHYNVLDLASAMCQVKPFEYLGSRLKDKLMNESIMCMNESFKLVYEQQHEMSRLKKMVETASKRSSLEDSRRNLLE